MRKNKNDYKKVNLLVDGKEEEEEVEEECPEGVDAGDAEGLGQHDERQAGAWNMRQGTFRGVHGKLGPPALGTFL